MKSHSLIATIFLLLIAVSSVSSFSSLPRKSSKRGRRGESSSLVTTRRVFCFTLSGGAHKFFSTKRRPASAKESSTSSSSTPSSTSLNYRLTDDVDEELALDECRKDTTMEVEHMSSHSNSGAGLKLEFEEEMKSKNVDSELVEAAKAFLPVAIEIGIVAVAAGTQRI